MKASGKTVVSSSNSVCKSSHMEFLVGSMGPNAGSFATSDGTLPTKKLGGGRGTAGGRL